MELVRPLERESGEAQELGLPWAKPPFSDSEAGRCVTEVRRRRVVSPTGREVKESGSSPGTASRADCGRFFLSFFD